MVRTAYARMPPRLVYDLTPLGEGLRELFDALREWGESVPAQTVAIIQPRDGVAMSMREIAMSCPLTKP